MSACGLPGTTLPFLPDRCIRPGLSWVLSSDACPKNTSTFSTKRQVPHRSLASQDDHFLRENQHFTCVGGLSYRDLIRPHDYESITRLCVCAMPTSTSLVIVVVCISTARLGHHKRGITVLMLSRATNELDARCFFVCFWLHVPTCGLLGQVVCLADSAV